MTLNLYNDDCFNIFPRILDNSVQLTLTDIPYGEVKQKSSGLRILDRGDADRCDFSLTDLVDQLVRVTSGSIYVFCGVKQISILDAAFRDCHGLTTRLAVWEKTNPSPMNGDKIWLSGMEFCVFARKPKATFNEHCQKAIWRFPSGRSKVHPTQKPLGLIEQIISASSNVGDLVFDPFMGSGTTGVACSNLGRRFIGIERNIEYFKIADSLMGPEQSDLEALLA